MAVSPKDVEAERHAKQKTTHNKVLRPVGHMENFHAALHSVGQIRGNSLTCRYGIPQPAEPLAGLVKTFDLAVARTVLEHPILQAGLVGEDSKKPAWVQLETVDLKHHIQWREVDDGVDGDAAVEHLLRAELDLKIVDQATRPGWRLVVLHRAAPQLLDAALIWNHTAFDGMGAKLFHENVLRYLGTPIATEDQLPLENRVLELPSSPARFTPSQEKMLKYTTTPRFVCSEAWKEWGPRALARQPEPITWAPISPMPIQTGTRIVTVGNQQLQNVLAACRTHKTTLTSLIHGLFALSFAEQLPKEDAPSLLAESPVNLRKWSSPRLPKYDWLEPNRTIVNCVTNMTHEFDSVRIAKIRSRCQTPLSGTERMSDLADVVWELAEYVRSDMEKHLNRGLKNNRAALMKLVPDWREYHRTTLKKPRTISWIISNLGVIDGNPKQEASDSGVTKWTVQKAVFALSVMPLAAVLEVCVVAVKGGDLSIGVSWHQPAVSEEFAEKTANNVREWLDFLGSR